MDYQSLYTKCHLCPRACGTDRRVSGSGVCGADATLRLGRAALHWWEEPCLVGEQGSGAVFFSYCPMKCVYCQNDALAHGQGVEITPARLRELFLELQNEQHAANINLVTPTHYVPHIAEALVELRSSGALTIPVVYNTSGYESVGTLALLDGLVDIYLTDYKYSNADVAKRLSRAKDYPEVALSALKEMKRQIPQNEFDPDTGLMKKGIIVRHLVLPGRVKETCEALCLLAAHFSEPSPLCTSQSATSQAGSVPADASPADSRAKPNLLLSIMGQYTPLASLGDLSSCGLDKALTPEEYEAVLDYADDLGFEDYFWQEGGAAKESFIPAFDGTGVLKNLVK